MSSACASRSDHHHAGAAPDQRANPVHRVRLYALHHLHRLFFHLVFLLQSSPSLRQYAPLIQPVCPRGILRAAIRPFPPALRVVSRLGSSACSARSVSSASEGRPCADSDMPVFCAFRRFAARAFAVAFPHRNHPMLSASSTPLFQSARFRPRRPGSCLVDDRAPPVTSPVWLRRLCPPSERQGIPGLRWKCLLRPDVSNRVSATLRCPGGVCARRRIACRCRAGAG